MHAVRVHTPGGPEAMHYEEVPMPQPAPGQAVVKMEAIGVNFIDTYHRTGAYPKPFPCTLGSEGAGTVTAIGDGVISVRVGDRVASESFIGAYAEYALGPAERLVQIPDDISTRHAAALMLQGMTAHYLATSTHPIQVGDSCLIHAAAGGVGALLCQIAKMRGARVIGTVSSEAKAKLAREAGADEVINYTRDVFDTEVKRITDGKGVQVVYDSVGRTTFDQSLASLARRGMLVLFGQSSGAVPPIDLQRLNRGGSLFVTRPTLADYVEHRNELATRSRDLFHWVNDGRLRVRIDRELPLAQAVEAHHALEGRRTMGKVLLIP